MSTIQTRATAAVMILLLVAGAAAADAPHLLRQPASAILDVRSLTTMPHAAPPGAVHSSSLDWVTLFSDDFEGIFPGPWEVTDQDTKHGEYYWGQRDCVVHQGVYSLWAAGAGADGAGLACGSNYPAYASSAMVYGPFDLSDASSAEVKYWFWLNSESGVDKLRVMASIDGTNFSGFSWAGDSEGWYEDVADLTDMGSLGDLTGQPQVWIVFWFVSDDSIEYPGGAYLDDVVIRKWVGPEETTTPAVTGTAGPTFTVTRTATPTSPAAGTVTPTRTATRTPTVPLTPSPTTSGTPAAGFRVFLPVVRRGFGTAAPPTPTATAPAAPTQTPTVPAGEELEFKGTTNQGREIEVKIKPDRSKVTFVELDLEFSCEGATISGKSSISSPTGWTITDRSFTVLSNVFEVNGSFDPTFTTVSGTWQGIRKTTSFPSVEICRGPVSNWSATRQ